MSVADWDDIGGGNKGNQGGSLFLRLDPDKGYKIRPIGKPLPLWTYYIRKNGKVNRAITSINIEKPDDCIIHTKYQEEPKLRFAINVLDREDVNEEGIARLKVLEAPLTVFKSMKSYCEATGKAPGGKEGADFFVKKVSPPDGKPINTRYEVTALGETHITEQEYNMIQNIGGTHDLESIYKVTKQEDIEEKLYGDSEEDEKVTVGSLENVGGKSDSSELKDIF